MEDNYFRIYIKEDTSNDEIQNLLHILTQNSFRGNVYFMRVSSQLLEELKKTEVKCFYAKSSIVELLEKDLKCLNNQEIIDLVYNPSAYLAA